MASAPPPASEAATAPAAATSKAEKKSYRQSVAPVVAQAGAKSKKQAFELVDLQQQSIPVREEGVPEGIPRVSLTLTLSKARGRVAALCSARTRSR
jgi:hypothetical protein